VRQTSIQQPRKRSQGPTFEVLQIFKAEDTQRRASELCERVPHEALDVGVGVTLALRKALDGRVD